MNLAQTLPMLAGVLLSLLFSYVPRLSDWYATLDATTKRLIMLGCLLAVSLLIFGAACGNILGQLPLGLALTCDQNGAVTLVVAFVFSIIGNQSVYQISPQKVNTISTVVDATTGAPVIAPGTAEPTAPTAPVGSIVVQKVKE